MTEPKKEPRKVPNAEDVSVDYLYKPRPRSHEFRFRMIAMLKIVTWVALLLGLLRLIFG